MRTNRRAGRALAALIACLAALAYFALDSAKVPPARFGRTAKHEARWCHTNRTAVDRAVAMWENENHGLPRGRLAWLEFDDRGRITRVSSSITESMRLDPVAAGHELAPGSTAIAQVAHDDRIFVCPRWIRRGSSGTPIWTGDAYFRWIADPRGIASPSGRWHTRGVICLMHGEAGPPGDPSAVHGLDTRL
jgi:hypothetical protein